MQNIEIEKAIPWNPWHGCKKVSSGCKNCFVYKMDQRYGRDTTIITKGKTTYELKDKNCPPDSLVKLCFSSDFFIEEADEWRAGCWDFVRRRKDCIFVTTTKRPERIKECVPPDWEDGWEHMHISISIENQEMAPKADVRPIKYEWVKNLYLEAKERNIEFYFHQSGSLFLKDGINIGKWNLKEQIKCAEEIQHELDLP